MITLLRGRGQLCTRLLAGLIVVCVGPVHAEGQGTAEQKASHVRNDLRRFHVLVDMYRDGDTTGVTELGGLTADRLLKMFEAAATPLDHRYPWEEGRFRAAAMLLTDIAIARLIPAREQAFLHVDLASRLLVKGGRELRPFASDWHCAVARLLRDRGELTMAVQLLDVARVRVAGDVAILRDSGILQEWIATARSVEGLEIETAPSLAGTIDLAATRLNARRTGHLREAAARFAESLEAHQRDTASAATPPWLVQLHAARTDMLLGRDREALRSLQRLTASPADDGTIYLGLLFTGAIHERANRLDEAAQAYEQAVTRLPGGHTAYVALSHVLQRRGDGERARATLVKVLTRPAAARAEPWWWYFFDPSDIVTARIDALRNGTRR